MYIVALVKSIASKQTIKEVLSQLQHSFEFVQSLANLKEALLMNPDYLILEAVFDEQDYEDIVEELTLEGKLSQIHVVLINNTADPIHLGNSVEFIIDEFDLAHQLEPIFTSTIQKNKSILYASDDRFMHKVIGDILRKNGFDVLVAYNGIEALNAYKTLAPDLVLTDLDMPKMNGLELCRAVKLLLSGKSTPVIILSGSAFEEDIQAAYACHAKAYLVKPIPPDKLVRKINASIH